MHSCATCSRSIFYISLSQPSVPQILFFSWCIHSATELEKRGLYPIWSKFRRTGCTNRYMDRKPLVPHHHFAFPALLRLLQLSTVWEAPGWGNRLFAKRGKSEVGDMGGESTSGEDEIRCDTARAYSEKTRHCWKSPSFSWRILLLPNTVLF